MTATAFQFPLQYSQWPNQICNGHIKTFNNHNKACNGCNKVHKCPPKCML